MELRRITSVAVALTAALWLVTGFVIGVTGYTRSPNGPNAWWAVTFTLFAVVGPVSAALAGAWALWPYPAPQPSGSRLWRLGSLTLVMLAAASATWILLDPGVWSPRSAHQTVWLDHPADF